VIPVDWSLGTCLRILPIGRLRDSLSGLRWGSSARLETRTKESNKCASHMLNESIRRTERESASCTFGAIPKSFDEGCSTGRNRAIGPVSEL